MTSSKNSAMARPPEGALARATAAIGSDEEGLLAALGELIARDTSYPPGAGYAAFADLLERLFTPLGFVFRRVSVPPELWASDAEGEAGGMGERINLIGARRTGLPACSLYFHTDTVPPGEGWTRAPLRLTREGNRLFGRGTADMKGSIVAALLALRAARAAGVRLAYDPMLLFCTDEEGGRYPGLRYLADQRLLEGHLLSLNGGPVPRIWAGCFGSFDLAIRVEGRAAHSGNPTGGVNAIEAALPLLNALSALKSRVQARRSALPAPPHYHGRPLTPLLNLAAAHGGAKGAALPARFELLVNRRYAPEESFEAALAELQETLERAMQGSAALGLESRLLGHLAPVSDPTGPHWPRWQVALCAGFGFRADAFRAWGSATSSDMGWVQRAGIREILLGGLARAESNVHGADEYTTIEDIVALARSILAYLAADFLPPPPSSSG